ncbi:hypothetical protein CK203_093475 [Vitis vinifera]|uniref:Transmembrane protein n=1 Tax=Vitis vinifera TaxID=29760 RepID=A0A438BNH3_VITVI|nr:hypothetical protein CK203_093475 [Vitis vinifera]
MGLALLYENLQKLWPFSALKFDDLKASDALVRKLPIPEHTKQFVFAVRDPESQSVIYILCAQNLSERSASDADHLIRAIGPDAVVAQVGQSVVADVQHEEGQLENAWFCERFLGLVFNGHFLAAKRAAEEVGSSFLLVESPIVGSLSNDSASPELGNKFQGLALGQSSLVSQKVGNVASVGSKRFCVTDEAGSRMVKLLSAYLDSSVLKLTSSSSVSDVGLGDFVPRCDYEAPPFCAKMLSDVNRGEIVDTKLLSEIYTFRIAVEGLRIALNNAARLPINKLSSTNLDEIEFSDLPVEDKSHALFAQALRSQTKKFKTIVAVVDASGLSGLRKHWNTPVPLEVKDLVGQLVTSCEGDEDTSNHTDRRRLLTDKPVVAVGAGATAVLGASSFSKVLPVSTFMKAVSFKVPASFKLILTQTQKAVAIGLGKTVGPTKVVVPGIASSGTKTTSVLKAAASAEKIRAVAHSMIASAEKTSFSAMRTSFYEIMRKRNIRAVGFLPWATFGCSIATCSGLLMYGDGIECAVESVPAAPSIASLGRGIRSLHQASQAVMQTEIQKSIESLMYRLKKVKGKLPGMSTLSMVKDFVDKNQASGIGSYDLAFAYPWKVFNGQEEAEIELGADSKCAPEDEGKKLKVKILVKWSGKDWLA